LNTRPKMYFSVLAVLVGLSAVIAQADGAQQDANAVDVLNQMAAYRSSLDQVTITGVTFTDATLGAGLIVANPVEVSVSIKRPASMRINSFDGEANKGLFFHDGLLTVYNSSDMFYAQADVPKDINAAMTFALEELDVETPFMDLLYQDGSSHLLGPDSTILYLTDKARVGGTDCHQIAIRGQEVDVQLWVEEGDRPVARKIMITSKWVGGAPRFTADLDWDTDPEFESGFFEFKAPEGATKIEFVDGPSEQ